MLFMLEGQSLLFPAQDCSGFGFTPNAFQFPEFFLLFLIGSGIYLILKVCDVIPKRHDQGEYEIAY